METFTPEKLDARLQRMSGNSSNITPSWVLAKRYFLQDRKSKIIGMMDRLLNANKKALSPKSLGDLLEALVEELMIASQIFNSVAGQRTNTHHKLYQLDHYCVLKGFVHDDLKRSYGENLSNSFIGESKNYASNKVDVTVAYKHIGIKLFNDTTFGAIFSRAGLTGSKDHKTAARGVLERFVHQAPKSVSVVFVDDDWRFLKSRPDLFGSLLIRKLIDLKLTREPQFFEHDKFADEVDTWRPELQSEQE